MSKYIDAENIEFHAPPIQWKFREYIAIQSEVEAIPEADVEPVRHGHWIKTGWQQGDKFEYKCFECKRNKIWKKKTQKLPNYCEKCGALMDKEVKK